MEPTTHDDTAFLLRDDNEEEDQAYQRHHCYGPLPPPPVPPPKRSLQEEQSPTTEQSKQHVEESVRSSTSSSSVAMTTVFSEDKLPEGDEVVMFRVEGVLCDFLAPPSFQPISLTSNEKLPLLIILMTDKQVKRRTAPLVPGQPLPPPRKSVSTTSATSNGKGLSDNVDTSSSSTTSPEVPSAEQVSGLYVIQFGENESSTQQRLRLPLCEQTPFIRHHHGVYFFDFFFTHEIYRITFPSNIPFGYMNAFEEFVNKICKSPLRFADVAAVEENAIVEISSLPLKPEVEEALVEVIEEGEEIVAKKGYLDPDEIEAKAVALSQSITRSGQYLSQLIEERGAKVKARSAPNEVPAEVSPSLERTINLLSNVTPYLARGTKVVIKAVAAMAAEVVDRLVDESGEPSQFKEVAAASIKGGAKILSSIEKAGEHVYDSTSSSVSGVVQHKYGDKAGDMTKKGFCIGRDVVETVSSVRGIVRKTAGKTASKVAKKKSEKRKKKNNPQLEGANEAEDEEKIEEGVEVDEDEGDEEEEETRGESPNGTRQQPTVTDIDSEEGSGDEKRIDDNEKLESVRSEAISEDQLKQTDVMSLSTK